MFRVFVCAMIGLSFASLVARAELSNESEAGVVITGGNSRTQSLSFKQANRYDWEKNAVGLDGSFLQTKNASVITAKRWDFQVRYERRIEYFLRLLLQQGVQSDRFAGYLQRLNTDFGPRYVISEEENAFLWAAESTYRFSREIKTTGQREYRQQFRLFTEVKQIWSGLASSRIWFEFIPSLRNVKDWEFRSEVSTQAAFNEIFSMKAAYLLKYDNVPATTTARKRDTEFTTSLVAKW